MASITLKAHTKINLTLTITGRRHDGYHLMDSLVVFADLADQITVAPNDTDHLTITGQQADALKGLDTADNILMKALNAYRKHMDWDQTFALRLEKNIPVAAGIGGGSSDAAAILTAANRLNSSPCSDADLAEIGLEIGADLPVCLKQFQSQAQSSAQSPQWRMQGIGEDLTPLSIDPLNKAGLLLVNPMVGVSTKDVFKRLRQSILNKGLNQTDDLHQDADLATWLARGNDLAAPAMALEPKIQHQIDHLSSLQGNAGYLHHGMSGSGATCFALFNNPDAAKSAHKAIKHKMAWSWAGKII